MANWAEMGYNYTSTTYIKSDGDASRAFRHLTTSSCNRGADTMTDHTLPLFSLQPETKEIPLSKGKVAIVDAADYEWLAQWSWHSMNNHGRGWYAKRTDNLPDREVTIYMHREILSAGKGLFVDHINGDGLDNRRINLRLATRQENMRNRHRQLNNTSGYRGVSWRESRQKWEARIVIGGRLKHLGRFDLLEDAALAYNRAAIEHFGEFASLNEVRP